MYCGYEICVLWVLVHKYHICALQSREVHLCFTVYESTFVLYSLGKYICALQPRKVHLYFTVQESKFVLYSIGKYICDLQS